VGLAKDRRSDRSQFRSSIASIVQFPVLKLPFSCPRGAPGLRPPCRRHRLRPRMAGRWHGVPVGVLAPHRAWSLRARLWSIGFGGVDLKISSAPPLPRPTFHSVAVGLPNPHYLECRGGLAFPCGVPSLPAARMQPSMAGRLDSVRHQRIVAVLTITNRQFCDSLDRPVHGIRSGPQRIQWYLFGVSFEIRHWSAPICRLDRRKFS